MTDKRTVMKHCSYCGQSFEQYDDGKGTPQLYCSKVCRNAAHKQRNHESRARRGKYASVLKMVSEWFDSMPEARTM